MKLLLTSAGWWKTKSIGEEFVKLVGKKPANIRILLVITPIKYLKRNKYIIRQLKQFKEVSIPKENVTFFQFERKMTKQDLKGVNVIFVFGGNTFEYLDGLRKTGLGNLIKDFVKKGGVYLGVSAGSYVACPTIEAASWKHADRNYMKLTDLRGLDLVPFLITAHFEEELRKLITRVAKKAKYPVIALTDKQAILVKGKKVKIIGEGEKNIFNAPLKWI